MIIIVCDSLTRVSLALGGKHRDSLTRVSLAPGGKHPVLLNARVISQLTSALLTLPCNYFTV